MSLASAVATGCTAPVILMDTEFSSLEAAQADGPYGLDGSASFKGSDVVAAGACSDQAVAHAASPVVAVLRT